MLHKKTNFFFSSLFCIIIFNWMLRLSLSLPIRIFSEYSVFHRSFVSLEDAFNDSSSIPTSSSRLACYRYPGKLEDSLTSGALHSCSLVRKLKESEGSMRAMDAPLAHNFRSYLAIEFVSKALRDSYRKLAVDAPQSNAPHRRNLPHSSFELSFLPIDDPEDQFHPSAKSLADVTTIDIVGILLIAIACTIAVCVGVGGGGMFVPILILLLGFTTHESTAIAQALMVGGTLAGLLLNWHQRHPSGDRPLIDVLLVLLLGPMQISGANVGVLLNRMIPSWLIIVLTIVVLGFTGHKTFIKGVQAYQKESQSDFRQKAEQTAIFSCQDEFSTKQALYPIGELRGETTFQSDIQLLRRCIHRIFGHSTQFRSVPHLGSERLRRGEFVAALAFAVILLRGSQAH